MSKSPKVGVGALSVVVVQMGEAIHLMRVESLTYNLPRGYNGRNISRWEENYLPTICGEKSLSLPICSL